MKKAITPFLFFYFLTFFTNNILPANINLILKNAWTYYKNNDFNKAEQLFKKALSIDSNNIDAWEGLLWVKYQKGKYNDVIATFRSIKNIKNEKTLLPVAWSYYKLKKYKMAEKYFYILLTTKYKKEATKGLLWTYKNQNKCNIFLKSFKSNIEYLSKQEKTDLMICAAKEKLDIAPQESLKLANKVLQEEPNNKKAKKIKIISIAKIKNKTERKFLKIDKDLTKNIPQQQKVFLMGEENFISFNYRYKYKKGKKGEDRLKEKTFLDSYLTTEHNNLLYQLQYQNAQASNDKKKEHFESFKITLFKKRTEYPYYKTKVSLGIEPINTQISPKIILNIEHFLLNDKIKITFFRENIKHSVQSFTGIKQKNIDGKTLKWGGCTRSGISISFNKEFNKIKNKLTLGANKITGKNVSNNYEYWFNFTTGTIKNTENNILWMGFFVYLTHFKENHNLYRIKLKEKSKHYILPAYGNGGYFSPEYLLAFGPAISLKTKEFDRLLLELNSSLSISLFKEEKGKLWRKNPDFSFKKLPLEVQETFFWLKDKKNFYFTKNKSSSIGGKINLKGLYLLTPYCAFHTELNYERYADYYQWYIGFGLRFYWDKRFGLYYSPVSP